MEFKEWNPIYIDIARDLGISIEADKQAAKKLDKLIDKEPDIKELKKRIKEQALVLGDAPTLKKELKTIKKEKIDQKTVLAADNATKTSLELDITPEIITTDLDGEIEPILEADNRGSLIVVHAHGDNQKLLERWVPDIKNIIGSTQTKPIGKLINPGGFTDGDRAAYLAVEYGARKIELCGFDYKKASNKKRKKLKWTEKLIKNLEKQEIQIKYTKTA